MSILKRVGIGLLLPLLLQGNALSQGVRQHGSSLPRLPLVQQVAQSGSDNPSLQHVVVIRDDDSVLLRITQTFPAGIAPPDCRMLAPQPNQAIRPEWRMSHSETPFGSGCRAVMVVEFASIKIFSGYLTSARAGSVTSDGCDVQLNYSPTVGLFAQGPQNAPPLAIIIVLKLPGATPTTPGAERNPADSDALGWKFSAAINQRITAFKGASGRLKRKDCQPAQAGPQSVATASQRHVNDYAIDKALDEIASDLPGRLGKLGVPIISRAIDTYSSNSREWASDFFSPSSYAADTLLSPVSLMQSLFSVTDKAIYDITNDPSYQNASGNHEEIVQQIDRNTKELTNIIGRSLKDVPIQVNNWLIRNQ